MRRFRVVLHEDGDWSSRFDIEAGTPDRRTLTSIAPGVSSGAPVVGIQFWSGTARGAQGQRLPAVRAEDARRLAWALLEAADAVDPIPCLRCKGTGEVLGASFVNPRSRVRRTCDSCKGRRFVPSVPVHGEGSAEIK